MAWYGLMLVPISFSGWTEDSRLVRFISIMHHVCYPNGNYSQGNTNYRKFWWSLENKFSNGSCRMDELGPFTICSEYFTWDLFWTILPLGGNFLKSSNTSSKILCYPFLTPGQNVSSYIVNYNSWYRNTILIFIIFTK